MKVTVERMMAYIKRTYPFLMEDGVFKIFDELCDTRALKILNLEKDMLQKDWPIFEEIEYKKAQERLKFPLVVPSDDEIQRLSRELPHGTILPVSKVPPTDAELKQAILDKLKETKK